MSAISKELDAESFATLKSSKTSPACPLYAVVISCHSLYENVPKVSQLPMSQRIFFFSPAGERLQTFSETLIKARTRLAFRDACISIFLECG